MKIYKNPFVSRKSYFIPVSPARTAKMEAKATSGYIIEEWEGKINIRRGKYYNFSLEREMPVVGEVSREALKDAIIQIVLAAVKEDEHDD